MQARPYHPFPRFSQKSCLIENSATATSVKTLSHQSRRPCRRKVDSILTPTPCHCADNDSYRQRSSDDDQGGDVALGIHGISVGINK
jgi:hypothetical protein